MGLGDSTADDILENAPDRIIGNVCSETIAWVYECNGNTLTEITATATMDALLAEFRLSMGFESI